jgi:putative membrane protein
MIRLRRYLPVLGSAIALGAGGAAANALATTDHAGHDHHGHDHHGHGHRGDGRHHGHGPGHYSAWDKQWLQTSIEGDLFEIQGGKLAQQQGDTQGVRDYGQRLVTDHTKSLQDATALANKLGIEVPKAPSPSMQWELQTVGSLNGAAFDAAYADLEAKDHQQDISEAQDEVSDGTNPAIRHDAKQEIPTLQQHLQIAEQLGGHQGEDPLP